jgi:hypothetical protein
MFCVARFASPKTVVLITDPLVCRCGTRDASNALVSLSTAGLTLWVGTAQARLLHRQSFLVTLGAGRAVKAAVLRARALGPESSTVCRCAAEFHIPGRHGVCAGHLDGHHQLGRGFKRKVEDGIDLTITRHNLLVSELWSDSSRFSN